MDTANPKPQIATILDDGTYGQRDMTDQEIASATQSQTTIATWPTFQRIEETPTE